MNSLSLNFRRSLGLFEDFEGESVAHVAHVYLINNARRLWPHGHWPEHRVARWISLKIPTKTIKNPKIPTFLAKNPKVSRFPKRRLETTRQISKADPRGTELY